MVRLRAVASYQCKVGENPLWDEREGRLYWAGIETGRLLRVDHLSGEHECFHVEIPGTAPFRSRIRL